MRRWFLPVISWFTAFNYLKISTINDPSDVSCINTEIHPKPSKPIKLSLIYQKKQGIPFAIPTWLHGTPIPSSHPPIPWIPWIPWRRWNEDTPEQAVGIHDRIRAVNGASGTPEERVLWRVVWGMKWALWVALGWVYPEKMGCNTVIHRKYRKDHPDMMDCWGFLKPDMGRKMWGYHEGNDVKLWCWVMKYEESIIIYWINWGSCHQTCGDIIWGVLGHES